MTVEATLTGGAASRLAAWQLGLRSSVGGTWASAVGPGSVAAGKQISCSTTAAEVSCLVWGPNKNVSKDGLVATLDLTVPANAPTGQATVTPFGAAGTSANGDPVALTVNTLTYTLAPRLSPCFSSTRRLPPSADRKLACGETTQR